MWWLHLHAQNRLHGRCRANTRAGSQSLSLCCHDDDEWETYKSLKFVWIISFLNFIKNAFRCRIICVMLIIVNYQKEKNVTARFSVCFHFITANIPGSWNLANEWDKKKESKWRINEWHTFKSKHGFSPLIRAPLQTPATLWGHRCWWCDSAVAAVAAVEASDLDRRTNFRRQFRDFAWRETGENQVREIAISSHLI